MLASEFNDFGQPLDVHSYDACLAQIASADYFVLLIGSRIGGWFDQSARISITRKEYQTAYELHLQGRLKIISFVRSDVWAVKDDRKELNKFLDELDIDPAKIGYIKSRPSKASSDAEALIEFLEEVGRNKQTNDVVRGTAATLPTGNWIHTFSSFRDVIDVLRGTVFAGRPVDQAVGRLLLKNELLEIASALLIKGNGGDVFFPFTQIVKFADSYPLHGEEATKSTSIQRRDFQQFFTILIHLSGRRLHLNVIDQILSSDVLMDFDPHSGTFRETDAYKALATLRSEVRSFMQLQQGGSVITVMNNSMGRAGTGSLVPIKVADLVVALCVADRAFNIVSLARALVRYLDGLRFEMPHLRPSTPFRDQVEQLATEHVSVEDALLFIAR